MHILILHEQSESQLSRTGSRLITQCLPVRSTTPAQNPCTKSHPYQPMASDRGYNHRRHSSPRDPLRRPRRLSCSFDHIEWEATTTKSTGDTSSRQHRLTKAIRCHFLRLSRHSRYPFPDPHGFNPTHAGTIDIPDHISLWCLRLRFAICQPLQQYANFRPTRVLRGSVSPLKSCGPSDLDRVTIRENSEGEYAGQGGRSHVGEPWKVATEVAIFTRHAVARLMRFAFETARKRPRKKITVGDEE